MQEYSINHSFFPLLLIVMKCILPRLTLLPIYAIKMSCFCRLCNKLHGCWPDKSYWKLADLELHHLLMPYQFVLRRLMEMHDLELRTWVMKGLGSTPGHGISLCVSIFGNILFTKFTLMSFV